MCEWIWRVIKGRYIGGIVMEISGAININWIYELWAMHACIINFSFLLKEKNIETYNLY